MYVFNFWKRYAKNELRHLQSVCKHRSNGTECPACPKVTPITYTYTRLVY